MNRGYLGSARDARMEAAGPRGQRMEPINRRLIVALVLAIIGS